MRLRHIVFGLCSAFLSAMISLVDMFVGALMVLGRSPQPMLAGGYAPPVPDRAGALDLALQHSLRHEAGVARRAAERHI